MALTVASTPWLFTLASGEEPSVTPGAESAVVEMSRNFVAAMPEAGREVEYVELPGGHLDVPSHPEFLPAVERFMVGTMHPEE